MLAAGVLAVAQQPQSFGAKHDSSYLLGLNPETGDLLWEVTLDKHPATILTQSPVVYDGVIYIGTSSNEEHEATNSKYECLLIRWTHVGSRSEDRQSDLADADGAEGIHGRRHLEQHPGGRSQARRGLRHHR